VRIEATCLTTFRDVTVVCGERKTATIDPNAVINPTVLVEVTSSSTEDYDRGDKLSQYLQVDALTAVLIVSHRRREVTIVERTADGALDRGRRALRRHRATRLTSGSRRVACPPRTAFGPC
jgi:Uma2 family endonuclease